MRELLKIILPVSIAVFVLLATGTNVCGQVLGFVYFTFVPGYLFLGLLSFKDRSYLRVLVFSVGLSIAFLMFLGLALCIAQSTLGVSRPLSRFNVLLASGVLVCVLFGLNIGLGKKVDSVSLAKANVAAYLRNGFLFLLPIASVIGALYRITILLEVCLLCIPLLCFMYVRSKRRIFKNYLPLVLGIVAISLLLQTVFVSKNLFGADIFSEFYVFRLTQAVDYWHPPGQTVSLSLIDSLNSVLSITVLPTVYVELLGIEGSVLFKLLYCVIFSFVPLILYKIYAPQIGRTAAFLSVFFFMSLTAVFYGPEPLSLARQIVGQLFFVLAMYCVMGEDAQGKNRILLIIFSAAIIVSHYSIAYLYLFYVAFLLVFSRFRIWSGGRKTVRVLSLSLVLLILAMTFFWYIYVSDSPLNQLQTAFGRVESLFRTDLLSVEARTQPALSSLSPTSASSLVGTIHKYLIYLDNLFWIVGLIVLLFKRDRSGLTTESMLAAMSSSFILVLCLTVPNLAATLNTTRFYALTIPFLAPLVVIGALFIVNSTGKALCRIVDRLTKVNLNQLGLYIVAFVLVLTLLFQSGLVNHIAGDYPSSYSLDLKRKEDSEDIGVRATLHSYYFVDQEVFGAVWLKEQRSPNSKVYADYNSENSVLRSYALLSSEDVIPITTSGGFESRSYIYLKSLNIDVGLVATESGTLPISNFSSALLQNSAIYSNGASEICYSP
jgi:uncharacterized membrane protein